MERRHQVFISSTFSDLAEERSEIIQALLELDCFPAGMEMFPATNEAAWDLIKKVIDDSDYYCLVVGGRYGSVDSEGISYTEREYDYALAVGKPLIAFLHSDPGQIPTNKCDSDSSLREKLTAFRAKIEKNHHCKYWSSPEDLGSKVSRAMVSLRKSHPSDGWVPGVFAADENTRIELATSKARIAELEAELSQKSLDTHGQPIESIAGGEDLFLTHVAYGKREGKTAWAEASVSWDTVLRYVGPTLIAECSDEELQEKIRLCFFHAAQDSMPDETIKFSDVVLTHMTIDQIKIQLRALGQMIPGVKRRAVADRKVYWKLTPAGEARLLNVLAIKKEDPQLQIPEIPSVAP